MASGPRDSKPPLGDIPYDVLCEVAKVLDFGATKHGHFDWLKGYSYRNYANAALRHVYKWLWKSSTDEESRRNHLAHAVCNLIMLLHWELNGKGHDDRC